MNSYMVLLQYYPYIFCKIFMY